MKTPSKSSEASIHQGAEVHPACDERRPPPSETDIRPANVAPTGLAAYDFGFGTTFFDHDNDGDHDLYRMGSTDGRGEGPEGDNFEATGRMLRRHGGLFEDITVRAGAARVAGDVDGAKL